VHFAGFLRAEQQKTRRDLTQFLARQQQKNTEKKHRETAEEQLPLLEFHLISETHCTHAAKTGMHWP